MRPRIGDVMRGHQAHSRPKDGKGKAGEKRTYEALVVRLASRSHVRILTVASPAAYDAAGC